MPTRRGPNDQPVPVPEPMTLEKAEVRLAKEKADVKEVKALVKDLKKEEEAQAPEPGVEKE